MSMQNKQAGQGQGQVVGQPPASSPALNQTPVGATTGVNQQGLTPDEQAAVVAYEATLQAQNSNQQMGYGVVTPLPTSATAAVQATFQQAHSSQPQSAQPVQTQTTAAYTGQGAAAAYNPIPRQSPQPPTTQRLYGTGTAANSGNGGGAAANGGGYSGKASASAPTSSFKSQKVGKVQAQGGENDLGEKWGQLKDAFGLGRNNMEDAAEAVVAAAAHYEVGGQGNRNAKRPKFMGRVSTPSSLGSSVFIMVVAAVAWFYGASSSVDWLRSQAWGKFVDGSFWNVAIWFILLLETFYVITYIPWSWPVTTDEWISSTVWLLVVLVDVITNYERISKWLPTFVLPGSGETIKWEWAVPVVGVTLSAMIAYFPERIFWNGVWRIARLRIQIRYEKMVKEYRRQMQVQAEQQFHQMYLGGSDNGSNNGGGFTQYRG